MHSKLPPYLPKMLNFGENIQNTICRFRWGDLSISQSGFLTVFLPSSRPISSDPSAAIRFPLAIASLVRVVSEKD